MSFRTPLAKYYNADLLNMQFKSSKFIPNSAQNITVFCFLFYGSFLSDVCRLQTQRQRNNLTCCRHLSTCGSFHSTSTPQCKLIVSMTITTTGIFVILLCTVTDTYYASHIYPEPQSSPHFPLISLNISPAFIFPKSFCNLRSLPKANDKFVTCQCAAV